MRLFRSYSLCRGYMNYSASNICDVTPLSWLATFLRFYINLGTIKWQFVLIGITIHNNIAAKWYHLEHNLLHIISYLCPHTVFPCDVLHAVSLPYLMVILVSRLVCWGHFKPLCQHGQWPRKMNTYPLLLTTRVQYTLNGFHKNALKYSVFMNFQNILSSF